MAYERFRFDDPSGLAAKTAKTAKVPGSAPSEERDFSHFSTLATGACERAAIAVEDGGIPSVYAMAWAHLQAGPPVGMDHTRWMQARDDAGAVLDTWGVAAARLGWPVPHLFEAPRDWIGGLVWEIGGGAVVVLADRQAVIERDGKKLFFCIPEVSR